MRLLKYEDDGEFSLTEFDSNNTPQYAILSHTWGADGDEVTFRDVTDGTGKNKAGYHKLTFCKEQVSKDSLQGYFWVDTCCIDKSSSAELTESINSMFHWYRKAEKCYVYLSDVSTGDSIGNNPSVQSEWMTAFRQSRWFTRGWTLQELIAPTRVEFFSAEGEPLGDKRSLMREIHSITGISIRALEGSPLSLFGIEERMSWTESRKTKRKEDMAYCLLGIFDVSMPLVYGEGQRKAMVRLRKEIRQSSDDQSLVPPSLLWAELPTRNPRTVSNVPFSKDRDFIERPNISTWIRNKCATNASRAALVGLGGVGKSQLAIQYCHDLRMASPSTWVFWVHVSTQARFEEGYRRIAEATKMDGWDNPKADILRLVRNWLCDESKGQWVIILDNADDASVFFHNKPLSREADGLDTSVEPLSDFLPQSANGFILITSRSRDVARRLTGSSANILEIKPMKEEEALALLQKKLFSSVNGDDSVELIRALDCMPLAITQAAAYIEERAPRMTIARYLNELSKSDRNRARLLNKDVGDDRRDGRASNSIIATWQISFEYIRTNMPTAARLLSLMSLFDRQGIPESLLYDQYGGEDEGDDNEEADFDDDIHTLKSFSLVEMSIDGQEFEMHRLVQFSTKKWLELHNELEWWKETFVKLMDDSYPVGEYENWPVCQALFPHAQAALDNKPQDAKDKDAKTLKAWASVIYKTAWYASEMGQYSKAHEMCSAALKVREVILGAEHPDTLAILNRLGLILECQGRFGEAEVVHQRALEARERVLGAGDPWTLTSMTNLASTYLRQGRWEAAEALFVEVMESRKKLDADHPDTLTSMDKLASTYSKQGRWEAAKALFVEVMETRKNKLGADHPDTLTSMDNLASIHLKQGQSEAAEALLVEVVDTSKRELGADHPNTLTSMGNLASTYFTQGRWEAAEVLFVEVMETLKKKLGVDHPNTLTSMTHLASMHLNQGRWEAAEALFVKVVDANRKKLGADHPNTLTSMDSLALTYLYQGQCEVAEVLFVEVTETRKKKLGLDHPNTLTGMVNLASTHLDRGQLEAAEALLIEVVDTSRKKLSTDHPLTLSSITNLALTYLKQGRWEAAKALLVEVMEIRKKKLGADHPSTLNSMDNLASMHVKQSQWEAAETLFKEVMETRKKKLGVGHPNTLTSMANIASMNLDRGQLEAAETLFVEVVDISKRELGAHHPLTLANITNLASTHSKQGRWEAAEALFLEVMETRKKKLGADNPLTLTSMANLALTYRDQGRWKEAEALEVQVIETRKMKLGDDHTLTLTSMNDFAFTLKGQGRDSEAIALMRQCVQLRHRRLGVGHPDFISSSTTLAEWEAEQMDAKSSAEIA